MKRLSPTRRLYIKVSELKEQMERLVAHDGTPEAIVKLSRVERRYWPLQTELLRRMDERDANAAKAKAWDALQKWKALNEAEFCSYYDLNNARDAADAAASEVN